MPLSLLLSLDFFLAGAFFWNESTVCVAFAVSALPAVFAIFFGA
jgi:hypothetical protein